jgi:hypothetical protein
MGVVKFQSEREKYAWLAAVIDGEGYLTLAKAKNPRSQHGLGFRPMLTVSGTNLGFLQEIKEACGMGSIIRRRTWPSRYKSAWVFMLYATGLRRILPRVEPFLIIKRRHAELLKEALFFTRRGFGGKRLEEIYWELRRLNQRGACMP